MSQKQRTIEALEVIIESVRRSHDAICDLDVTNHDAEVPDPDDVYRTITVRNGVRTVNINLVIFSDPDPEFLGVRA